MSEHRVSMRGASWRRYEDPLRSRDPQVRAVVSALATLPAPAPRPEFRAELRAQLVAIAPRLVAEAAEASSPMIDIVPRPTPATRPATHAGSRAGRPRHADGVLARVRGIPIGRPLTVAASVITVFALLLGGAVWMSKKALPGDTLYGLKRASERVELATAGSDTEKAKDYLGFAVTRAGEVRDLLSRAGGSAAGAGPHAAGINSDTAQLITSTLASADSDVKSASTLLGKQAVKKGSPKPLATMTDWAPKQLSRLQGIAAAMPSGSLRGHAESSADLVRAALARAESLAPKLGCGCLASSGTDELGPVPCTPCTVPTLTPNTPSSKTSTAPGRTHNSKGRAGTNRQSPAATGAGQPATKAASPSSSSSPGGGLQLPTLPVTLPTTSLPVTVTTCGITVIGITIELCPSLHIALHP